MPHPNALPNWAKGHLISKGLFGFFNSPKKQTVGQGKNLHFQVR